MFKEGDRVLCVNNFHCDLTLNKSYIIDGYLERDIITDELVSICDYMGKFKSSRFELDMNYYRQVKINKILKNVQRR